MQNMLARKTMPSRMISSRESNQDKFNMGHCLNIETEIKYPGGSGKENFPSQYYTVSRERWKLGPSGLARSCL